MKDKPFRHHRRKPTNRGEQVNPVLVNPVLVNPVRGNALKRDRRCQEMPGKRISSVHLDETPLQVIPEEATSLPKRMRKKTSYLSI